MMAKSNSSLVPEIGPDGLPHEAPVIAYTEKIIEEEQLQVRKYIEENYSKIRDVERELASLSLEMKLTAGPKKAALEHMRKKIEMSTEKIRVAKLKEEETRKAWEIALKAVKDEEETKQKLCEDLSRLVQESSNAQFTRLEELKRRLEALNPSRTSASIIQELRPAESTALESAPGHHTIDPPSRGAESIPNQVDHGNGPTPYGGDQPSVGGEGRGKKKILMQGKGNRAIVKGRASNATGWTGAGFDVDGKS